MDVIEMTIAPESSITVAHGNLVDGNTSLGCMTEWTGATRIASRANIDFSAYGGGIRNLQDATPGNGGTVSWATRPLRLYGAVFSGQFVNSAGGELIKGSLDTLLLNGDSSGFTGTTTVAGGELIVGDTNNSNARLGGTISILSGATLGGYGSVGETKVLAGGVLSPGNSIGTLTVDGSLQLASGSTFGVEIAGNGSSDRVNVRSMATISGGTVAVTAMALKLVIKTARTISSCTLIRVLAERLILIRRERRFLT